MREATSPKISHFNTGDPRMAAARRIRQIVFCDEQQISASLEWDGEDDVCEHVLAEVDGVAQGTARYRSYGDGAFKVERVAVTKEMRGRGIGEAIMRDIMKRLQERGATAVVLNAQASVEGFYLRLGFSSQGEHFLDAGIPHVYMTWPAGA